MMISDGDALNRIAGLTDDQNFVYDSRTKQWHTYHEVWNRAFAIGNSIKKQGQKTVIAIMDNGLDLFTLYFACILSDTTIVPIDPQKSRKEIDSIIAEHTDYLLLTNEADIFLEKVPEISVECIKQNILTINLDKVYMITYTSGSTGHAKGVMHNLRSLFLASTSFGNATALNSEYTMCHVMPMTYMAGILNTIFMPFFCGTKIALLPRFDVMSAVRFWKDAEKLKVTAFWLSPTMLNVLMTVDKKGKSREYLSQHKTLFYIGTAPLLENTRQRFEEKYGVKLLQSYGLSETLFISTEIPHSDNDIKSVGTILPDVQIDIDSNEEVCIDVPWMFLGYSNEKTSDYFVGNAYKSGDMGRIDDKNRLYITGRIKDLIVKGGMNISPTQIEKCLLQCKQITECAVAGVSVNEEENIVCWYVLEANAELSPNVINIFLEKELGRHCRIDFFRPVDSIPKNLNGKTDKKKLIREFTL